MPGCRQVFPVPEGLTQNSLEMWSLVLCLRGTFRKNSEGGFQLSTHITGSQQQTLLSLHGLGFPGVRASCSCGFSSRTDGSSDSPCTRCRLSPAHPWVLLGGCPFHFPELHGDCGSGRLYRTAFGPPWRTPCPLWPRPANSAINSRPWAMLGGGFLPLGSPSHAGLRQKAHSLPCSLPPSCRWAAATGATDGSSQTL